MIRIHDVETNELYPLLLDDDKKFVVHKYDGYDTMTFEISTYHELYDKIYEEVIADDMKNEYVIRHIDEHSDFVTIDCELNIDDWKVVYTSFRETNISLTNAIAMILPNGWTETGSEVYHDRHTVEDNNKSILKAKTGLQILEVIRDTWGCVFNFNAITKKLTTIRIEDKEPSCEFLSEDVNLKSIGYVGNSANFATRIYPYGKRDSDGLNPLTIASVNDGKEYLEDTTYYDKIISFGWSDERYTVPEDLKAAALLKLAEVSIPSKSYSCEVKYFHSPIHLYQIITLIDKRRKAKINHRIVEWKQYEDSSLDVVTLTSTGRNIADLLSKLEKKQEDINEQRQQLEEEVKNVTRYLSLYTIEFVEMTGPGTFYFTRKYTDEPYFLTKPYNENLNITFKMEAYTNKYLGATLAGVGDTDKTFIVFFCALPREEQ